MEIFELIGVLPESLANEIYSVLNHQQRRVLEKKYGPRQKRTSVFSLKPKPKPNPKRVFEGIAKAKERTPAEEVFRAWLLAKKREMLKLALDWAKIPHQDGITSHDLDALTKAPASALVELLQKLKSAGFEYSDALIYFVTIDCEQCFRIKELREVVQQWGGEHLLPEVSELVEAEPKPKEEPEQEQPPAEEKPKKKSTKKKTTTKKSTANKETKSKKTGSQKSSAKKSSSKKTTKSTKSKSKKGEEE